MKYIIKPYIIYYKNKFYINFYITKNLFHSNIMILYDINIKKNKIIYLKRYFYFI